MPTENENWTNPIETEPKQIGEILPEVLGALATGQVLPDKFADERQKVRQQTEQGEYDDLVREGRELILEAHHLVPEDPEDAETLRINRQRQKEVTADLQDFPDAVHPE